MSLDEDLQKQEIGRGRSAVVFLDRDSHGSPIVRKVFNSGGLFEKLLNYLSTGAPNAYFWSEDAVRSAYYRSKVFEELVPYWTDSKVMVSYVFGIRWNEEFKAYELQKELIDGRHVSLHHPFSADKEQELKDLIKNVMIPLQQRLIEAGFDGSVWQAGKGNPAGPGNFLIKRNKQWVWIDNESGVPATNPLAPSFFSYYLPKWLQYKHPLFDDVDSRKLRQHVDKHKEDLETKIGSERYNALISNAEQLEIHQKRWKSMRRAHRSIMYQLKKEGITQKQSEWYFKHPGMWYTKEAIRLSWESYMKLLGDLPLEIYNRAALILLDWKRITSNTWKFVSSQGYRSKIAKNYVSGRIDAWQKRDQLTSNEASHLHSQLKLEESSSYITDFGVHIAIKPFVKGIEYIVLPSLYTMGLIGEITLGTLIVYGGYISRNIYTIGRFLQSTINGEEKPWVALGVGLLPFPVIGIFSYPSQMIYSAKDKDAKLAKFVLYDPTTRIGEIIPIWGGRDTLTEHFFNGVSDLIARNRKGLYSN